MMRSGLVQMGLIRFWTETKEVAFLGAAAWLGVLYTSAVALMVCVVARVLEADSLITTLLPVLIVSTLPYSLALWRFQAEGRFLAILYLRLAYSIPFMGLVLSMLSGFEFSIQEIAIYQILLYSLSIPVLLQQSWLVGMRTFTKVHSRKLWNYGRYSLSTLLGANLLKSSDTFLIGLWLSAGAVALFQVPYKLIEAIEIPIRSQINYLMPSWAALTPNQLRQALPTTALKLTLWVLPVSIGCFWFAEEAIGLVGGEAYRSSVILMKVFAVYGLLLPTDRLLGVALDALGKPQLNTLKVFTMVVVNVVGDLLVLSLGGSLWQIALVTVVTTFAGVLAGLYMLYRFSVK
jgi:O-antigen/teichoic acid export membrane protein